MRKVKIGVMGVAGRMGCELVRSVLKTENCTFSGGTEKEGSSYIGHDVGVLSGLDPIGVFVTSDASSLISKVDAILDFTTPASSVTFAGLAANQRIVHVIGTTGFCQEDEAAIASAAKHATIIKSSNMSLGVNLVAELTRKVAAILSEDFDIEILEMHHRQKIDSPSGTALMLGKAAADGRNISFENHKVCCRDGEIGKRNQGDIGFAVLRGGSVIGEHSAIFAGDDEIIEVTHKAIDRKIFSQGAVKAAIWAIGKGPGLFNMADVLGFS
ncbi:MAG: 4-hydroxy-tetrahydrodipicolinate reductase [Hyphomicrobiaceae bacterium hypho_1]